MNQTINIGWLVSSHKSEYLFITFFGILTNCVIIFVCRYGQPNELTFNHVLATTARADFAYLLIFHIDSLLKMFKQANTYIEQLYQLFCVNYLSSSLAMFVLLIDTIQSLHSAFNCFSKFYIHTRLRAIGFIILLFVSFIFYSPELFSKNINPIKSNKYAIKSNSWGSSNLCTLITLLVWLIRMIVLSVVLIIANISYLCASLIRVVFRLKRNISILIQFKLLYRFVKKNHKLNYFKILHNLSMTSRLNIYTVIHCGELHAVKLKRLSFTAALRYILEYIVT